MIARRSFLRSSILTASILSVPAMSSASPKPSRIHDLIAALGLATARLDKAQSDDQWSAIADDRSRIIEDLLGEYPATIAELHAKLTALMPIYEEDDEDQTLIWVVARDIAALAGEGE